MKKLMIAAAIVCAAVAAHAASANWSVTDIYDWDDISSSSPSYEVMAYDYYTLFVVATDSFGVDDAKAAIKKSDFSWMTTQQTQVATTAMSEGAASGTTPNTWFGNNESIDAFVVIFNNEDYNAADHAYVTGIATGTTGAEGQAASIGVDGSDSYIAGEWTAIPEPTSAMLLLLGCAGLALKRKQK